MHLVWCVIDKQTEPTFTETLLCVLYKRCIQIAPTKRGIHKGLAACMHALLCARIFEGVGGFRVIKSGPMELLLAHGGLGCDF